MAPAACSTSRNVVSAATALAGLTSAATRVAAGTNSRSSPNCFAANSRLRKLIPVRLLPGRARLATRPSLKEDGMDVARRAGDALAAHKKLGKLYPEGGS